MATTTEFPKVKVAVALLCYNNADLLRDFLPTLLASTPEDPEYGIFVIDNASRDETPELLEGYSDRLHIITIQTNRGFTNGYQEGLSNIDAEIFCLLSSDVEVSQGWIQPVIKMFDDDAKVAIVQPKVKSWKEKSHFEYAGASGGFIDRLGFPFCRGRIFYNTEEDKGQYNDPMEIFWASGACFFIRAKLYHESGGLDNDFYAHMEEIDLCWRLKNRGYKIMVCPQAEVYHIGGAVISYGSPEKTFRNHRNNLIMMVKNLPGNEVFSKITARIFLDALAFANMIARGQIRASFSIVSAHWSFFLGLPKWLAKRRELRSWSVAYSKTGIFPGSIIVQYFVKGARKFSDLNWNP